MDAPLARTGREAHLYMDMHPCECGEARFGRDSSVGEVDGVWLCRYQGECERCGRERLFDFRTPDGIVLPPDGAWSVDGTSELLDAGEWLWLADALGAEPVAPAGGGGAALAQARDGLASAAAAIDEALRFLPAGAETMPDSAFWSQRGARVRAAEPGRFRRVRLVAAAQAYRSMLAELEES
jgi:hypothetical protein